MNLAMNNLLDNSYFIAGNLTFRQTTAMSLVSDLAPFM